MKWLYLLRRGISHVKILSSCARDLIRHWIEIRNVKSVGINDGSVSFRMFSLHLNLQQRLFLRNTGFNYLNELIMSRAISFSQIWHSRKKENSLKSVREREREEKKEVRLSTTKKNYNRDDAIQFNTNPRHL